MPVVYAGFWIRTGAAIVDSILVMLIIAPLLTLIYGGDYWLDQTQALSQYKDFGIPFLIIFFLRLR